MCPAHVRRGREQERSRFYSRLELSSGSRPGHKDANRQGEDTQGTLGEGVQVTHVRMCAHVSKQIDIEVQVTSLVGVAFLQAL